MERENDHVVQARLCEESTRLREASRKLCAASRELRETVKETRKHSAALQDRCYARVAEIA